VHETQQGHLGQYTKGKNKQLRSLGKRKMFSVGFESVNGINLTKWWRQIVPSARSSHSERVVAKWRLCTWHCDTAVDMHELVMIVYDFLMLCGLTMLMHMFLYRNLLLKH